MTISSARGGERLFLLWRSREDNNVRSKRVGKLHTHVTQSAEPDHADFLALGNTQWRMGE